MKTPAEIKERAYRIWKKTGQNTQETEKRLKAQQIAVSRQTIAKWREQFGWEARDARELAAEKETTDELSQKGILRSLLKQKQRYEEYFEIAQIGEIDVQATYAYAGILKTILQIQEKAESFSIEAFSIFFKDIINFFSLKDAEISTAISNHFDEFMQHIKGKYGIK